MKKLSWLSLLLLSCITSDADIYNTAQTEATNTVNFIKRQNNEKLKDCAVDFLLTDVWPHKIWYVRCPNSTTTTIRRQPSGKSFYDVPIVVDDTQPD